VKVYHQNRDKIWVVGNGANTELFQPMEQRKAKQELGLSTECRYVTFVGELSPEQGVEHVIEAAPLILSQVPRTKFLIVGDGSERAKWSNMVSRLNLDDAFIFTGHVPYQKVPLFINAGNVCAALIRRKENAFSSIKMHEYMSCGKPIVAANNLAFGILEEYQCGLLVNVKDPQQVAAAILKLLQNKELAQEMGRRGREYVVENRSWKSVAKKVSQVCREVMQ